MKYNVTVRKAKDGKLVANDEDVSFGKLMHILNKWYTKFDHQTIDEEQARLHLQLCSGTGLPLCWMGRGSKLVVIIKHVK